MPSPSVSVESVTKRFSGHTAVNRLSLQVSAGGIFGLLGPNGAGKSTTIRLIMGILEPDEGSVSLFGSAHGSRKLSARIGYLPEERGLYKKMKVLDHLIFLGETKGISRADARRRALAWLDALLALPRRPMLRTRAIARADLVAALQPERIQLEHFLDAWMEPDTQAGLKSMLARIGK